VGNRRVTGRIGDEGGESANQSASCLVAIEGARVCEDLDANVAAFSVDVRGARPASAGLCLSCVVGGGGFETSVGLSGDFTVRPRMCDARRLRSMQ